MYNNLLKYGILFIINLIQSHGKTTPGVHDVKLMPLFSFMTALSICQCSSIMAANFLWLIFFSEEEAYLINSMINGLHPSNQLKANLKKKLSAIYGCTSIADYVHSEKAVSNINELETAVREKRKVILKAYESANSHEVSDRFVEPFEFTTNCTERPQRGKRKVDT